MEFFVTFSILSRRRRTYEKLLDAQGRFRRRTRTSVRPPCQLWRHEALTWLRLSARDRNYAQSTQKVHQFRGSDRSQTLWGKLHILFYFILLLKISPCPLQISNIPYMGSCNSPQTLPIDPNSRSNCLRRPCRARLFLVELSKYQARSK